MVISIIGAVIGALIAVFGLYYLVKEWKDPESGHLYTNEQLKKEYDYIMAEKLTKGMLEKGLISLDEFNKIMAENRKIFSPLLADIFA